ncbi:MAG: VPLPA-CTERM sorting domain-containing protein [Qingshengfaniella sp.]
MNIKNFWAVAVVTFGVVSSASFAEAQAYPTFELDAAASSIDVRNTGCRMSCPVLTAEIGPGVDSFSWTPTAADDSVTLDNAITWQVAPGSGYWGTGGTAYEVSANLVFSSPSPAQASSSGTAYVASVFGTIAGGILRWSNASSTVFADGSALDVVFQDLDQHLFNTGNTVSSAVTFVGNLIAPSGSSGGSTIATPLPASLWMLVAGMGVVGSFASRKRRGAANA